MDRDIDIDNLLVKISKLEEQKIEIDRQIIESFNKLCNICYHPEHERETYSFYDESHRMFKFDQRVRCNICKQDIYEKE